MTDDKELLETKIEKFIEGIENTLPFPVRHKHPSPPDSKIDNVLPFVSKNSKEIVEWVWYFINNELDKKKNKLVVELRRDYPCFLDNTETTTICIEFINDCNKKPN